LSGQARVSVFRSIPRKIRLPLVDGTLASMAWAKSRRWTEREPIPEPQVVTGFLTENTRKAAARPVTQGKQARGRSVTARHRRGARGD
jgi:hypothetical protein